MKCFTKTALAAAALGFAAHAYAADTNVTNATPNTISVSPEERTKIEEVVHQYLIQKPEVIVEAIQSFQRKQYEQAEQTVKKTQQTASTFATPLFHQTNDPVAGNPNGKISIVEFFDYQCPHCVDMAPAIQAIIKGNPDVRIVFKEFPIRGPVSDFASRAALAANMQGKYYQFSHALLTANKPLTQEVVYQIAQQVGLNLDKLKKDMNDPTVTNQIKNNVKLAQDLKLFGTPAFFIGKTDSNVINYVPGRMDQTQLQTEIDKAKQS